MERVSGESQFFSTSSRDGVVRLTELEASYSAMRRLDTWEGKRV